MSITESGDVAEADPTTAHPEVASDEELSPEIADLPIVTSDAELSFQEALDLSGRRGARLVLLMGESGTGKTTIIVELWTALVGSGPLQGFTCAGSRTAIPLEERAFLSRMTAGVGTATTPRTKIDANEGLLHVRVARPDGERIELLLADYAGERFRHVREGTELLTELPWVPRVDRVAVIVDGAHVAHGGVRELAFNAATRYVLALGESGAFAPTSSLAIIVAKTDELTEPDLLQAQPRLGALLDEARRVDPLARVIQVAARPSDGSPPVGLDALMKWLCSDSPAPEPVVVQQPIPTRHIGRFPS